MSCRSSLFRFVCAVALLQAPLVHAADPDFEHRRFQLDQQQDALNLNLQQNLRGRAQDLAPADTQRLETLQLQQRLQYQQLEQQQRVREESLRRSVPASVEGERQLDSQRQRFAQERQLELQRFELDRQRLLQSLPRQPLQPPAQPGRINLP
jgi:hypothetical protein